MDLFQTCTRQEVWFELEEGLEVNLVGRIVTVWGEIRQPLSVAFPLYTHLAPTRDVILKGKLK